MRNKGEDMSSYFESGGGPPFDLCGFEDLIGGLGAIGCYERGSWPYY